MWPKVRLLLHKVLPLRVRWYLLDRDIRKMAQEDDLPPASDVLWVDSQEELERELFEAEERYADGLHRTN